MWGWFHVSLKKEPPVFLLELLTPLAGEDKLTFTMKRVLIQRPVEIILTAIQN